MTREQVWQATLGELELTLSKANFTTWFKNTFIEELEESHIVVAVPNTFTKAWLENKYHKYISHALQNVTGNITIEVHYRVCTKKSLDSIKKESEKFPLPPVPSTPSSPLSVAAPFDSARPPTSSVPASTLNPRYTFENFVVGKNNELARAACLAVVKRPGTTYNPLFIYGGVGLGKTHLMQAVGHEIQRNYPSSRVTYVTSEKFTNEYIQSVQHGKTEDFKKRYRTVDVLLIDDIQFISGKEGTQEEFFHTFNTLHQANKQIILTSDRPPKAIPALEERLVSRFNGGMIADISMPQFEMRMAILEQKCRENNYHFDADVLHFIAENIQNNIRELEGALNKLVAFRDLKNITIDLAQAKEILGSVVQRPQHGALTTRRIIEIVAKFFEVSIDDLMGVSRKKELVTPRQIAMYLMREELNSSYPNIGREFGGRDHTTAMHAYTKMVDIVQRDERLKQDLIIIRQRLFGA